MPRALISVTDKTGLLPFARELSALGWEIVSTGGTAKELAAGGVAVVPVEQITGFPEVLDGRVKTLHPLVHAGLLADRRKPEHQQVLEELGLPGIDLLVVNLYRFEQTVSGEHSFDQAIESIDIGGPAMIRAAAKNHENVAVVVSPADYPRVLAALQEDTLGELKRELAAKAFRHTAYYDSVVAAWLSEQAGSDVFPEELSIGFRRVQPFRYGENPHQPGAWYRQPLSGPGIAEARQLWGKEMSFNNLLDAHAAWELVCDMGAGCAIIKHGNPCGAALSSHLGDAYLAARQSDAVSAFGGVAAFGEPVDLACAEAMTSKGNFLEVVIAPSFAPEAVALFQAREGWGESVRLLEAPKAPAKQELTVRWVRGGAAVQMSDEDPGLAWRCVTEMSPSDEQMAALKLLWTIIPHVKSNAILVGTADRMLGCGAGQQNRVRSVRLALEQAGDAARGAALASDAFFPFPDSIQEAAKAGIAAVIQPGGSKKDEAVIQAANELGISMVFTGVRHFLH